MFGRPQWKTVRGRSRGYVKKLVEAIEGNGGKVECGNKVVGVRRNKNGGNVEVQVEGGRKIKASKVVFAVRPRDVVEILGEDGSEQERRVLNGFGRSTRNRVVIHRDERFMPRDRRNWTSWNFRRNENFEGEGRLNKEEGCMVTYWLNRLQNLDPILPNIFETLNPGFAILESKVLASFYYEHPLYTVKTKDLQMELELLQGQDCMYFVGAWTGYGFHEDGFQSGINIANMIGGGELRPWKRKEVLVLNDHSRGYRCPSNGLPGLLMLNSVVEKVYEVLNYILGRDEGNGNYGIEIVGHLGKVVRVGKRISGGSKVIVRDWKIYGEIMKLVESGVFLFVSDIVIQGFIEERLDIVDLDGFRLFMLSLTYGQFRSKSGLKDEKRNPRVDPLTLPDPFSTWEKALLRLALAGEYLSSKWQSRAEETQEDVEVDNAKGDAVIRRITNGLYSAIWWDIDVKRPKGMRILELFGGLEPTTLNALEKDRTAKASIIVETEEDLRNVLAKCVVMNVETQVHVCLYEEFESASERKFDCVRTSSAINLYNRYWGSISGTLRFMSSLLEKHGTVELGFTCCADGARRQLAQFEESNYRLLTTRAVISSAMSLGLEWEALRRREEKEAAEEVRNLLQDIDVEPLSRKQARKLIGTLIRWETSLEVGRISRVATVLRKEK